MPRLVATNLTLQEFIDSKNEHRKALNIRSGRVSSGGSSDNRAFRARLFISLLVTIGVLVALHMTIGIFGTFFDEASCESGCPEVAFKDWDKTFSCPNPVAQPKQLCLIDTIFCPISMNCSSGLELCIDGTCALAGSCPSAADDGFNVCADACGNFQICSIATII